MSISRPYETSWQGYNCHLFPCRQLQHILRTKICQPQRNEVVHFCNPTWNFSTFFEAIREIWKFFQVFQWCVCGFISQDAGILSLSLECLQAANLFSHAENSSVSFPVAACYLWPTAVWIKGHTITTTIDWQLEFGMKLSQNFGPTFKLLSVYWKKKSLNLSWNVLKCSQNLTKCLSNQLRNLQLNTVIWSVIDILYKNHISKLMKILNSFDFISTTSYSISKPSNMSRNV